MSEKSKENDTVALPSDELRKTASGIYAKWAIVGDVGDDDGGKSQLAKVTKARAGRTLLRGKRTAKIMSNLVIKSGD